MRGHARGEVGIIAALAGARSYLPRCIPKVRLALKTDPHEDEGQLDACPEKAPQGYHAVASSKSRKHHRFKRNVLSPIRYSNTQERGVRLGGDAVDLLVEGGVHTIAPGPQSALGL